MAHTIIDADSGAILARVDNIEYIRLQDNGTYGLCPEAHAQGVSDGSRAYQLAGRPEMTAAEPLPRVVIARVDSSRETAEIQAQVQSAQAVSSIAFVVMAQSEQLDDVTITEHADQFPVWDENWRGKEKAIVQDEGSLYRSIHNVTDAGQNRKPSATPSMWTKIGNPADEWPDWSQPIGQHDAYQLGAKVTYNGKHWICTGVDANGNNTWQPGVYGWTEQK